MREKEPIQPPQVSDEPFADPEDQEVVQGFPGGMEGGIEGGATGGHSQGAMGGLPGGEGAAVDGGLPGAWSDEDVPVYLTGEVRPPQRTTFVKPEYPEIARRARAEGKVILEIVVGRTGEVESVRVLRSQPLFDQAAIEAVARWRYNPALQSGQPVRVYLTVIVEFGLN
ncbi:MAG: energy transducer TonB [Candidatus Polarisedimenticolia bacterium]